MMFHLWNARLTQAPHFVFDILRCLATGAYTYVALTHTTNMVTIWALAV